MTPEERETQILSLAHKVAYQAGYWYRRFQCQQAADYEELVQDGWIGAIRCVPFYDPHQGATLATWAESWIKNEILVGWYRRRHGSQKYPVRRSQWAPAAVLETLEAEPVPDPVAREEACDEVRDVVAALSPQDQRLLARYYTDEATMTTIAAEVGITDGQLYRHWVAAIQALRRYYAVDLDRPLPRLKKPLQLPPIGEAPCAWCGVLTPISQRQTTLRAQGQRIYCPDHRKARSKRRLATERALCGP